MNLPQLGHKLDLAIRSFSPGWSARRDAARLESAKSRLLAAAYDAAKPTMQRKPRSVSGLTESTIISEMDLCSLRQWSEDTFRNSSIMAGIMRRAVDNIVGEEVVIQPASSDTAFNDEVQAGWREYSSRAGGWEVTNRWTMGQYQRATLFGIWRSGDSLIYRADPGWQFFEAHQIGTPRGYNPLTMNIIGGIETDDAGMPLYYWVSNFSKLGYLDPRTARGLRADHCRHIVNLEWLSGMRGVPIFGNLLPSLEDFGTYMESTLLSAMARACVVAEMNSPYGNAGAALDVRPLTEQARDASDRPKPRELRPGMIIETRNSEKFTLHSPMIQGGEFAEYVRLNLRLFGMPLGMPLELTVMDASQTNFAAAKLSCAQAAKTQAFWRNSVVVKQATEPIYFDFLESEFGKSKHPDNWKKYEAIPPESDWINALQESNALNAGIKGGWDTITRIAREEMRPTVDSVFDDRATEIVKAKAACVKAGLSDEHWHDIIGSISAESSLSNPPADPNLDPQV